ncbi:MAG: NAD(P)-dependent oxidoreductase [Acidiferrobacterales bacterium]|nr:NAD(P)-dependent oxidoreductase [Acidiferrobacterales bacterium]
MSKSKVVLFGGNGFVGIAIAEELVHQGITPICVSRSGAMPNHLAQSDWAEQAEWIQGDALEPDIELFNDAIAAVTLIGSPPVPTFSRAAYQRQLAINSEPNLAVIKAMQESPVERLVVLGAHLPRMLLTDKFGYAKGKRLCAEAAQAFVEKSETHSAVVLKPTAIYGTRYNSSGKAVNLGLAMKPIANLQSKLPKKYLPETLVSVQAVAIAAVDACCNQAYQGKFTVLSNQEIVEIGS